MQYFNFYVPSFINAGLEKKKQIPCIDWFKDRGLYGSENYTYWE